MSEADLADRLPERALVVSAPLAEGGAVMLYPLADALPSMAASVEELQAEGVSITARQQSGLGLVTSAVTSGRTIFVSARNRVGTLALDAETLAALANIPWGEEYLAAGVVGTQVSGSALSGNRLYIAVEHAGTNLEIIDVLTGKHFATQVDLESETNAHVCATASSVVIAGTFGAIVVDADGSALAQQPENATFVACQHDAIWFGAWSEGPVMYAGTDLSDPVPVGYVEAGVRSMAALPDGNVAVGTDDGSLLRCGASSCTEIALPGWVSSIVADAESGLAFVGLRARRAVAVVDLVEWEVRGYLPLPAEGDVLAIA